MGFTQAHTVHIIVLGVATPDCLSRNSESKLEERGERNIAAVYCSSGIWYSGVYCSCTYHSP